MEVLLLGLWPGRPRSFSVVLQRSSGSSLLGSTFFLLERISKITFSDLISHLHWLHLFSPSFQVLIIRR